MTAVHESIATISDATGALVESRSVPATTVYVVHGALNTKSASVTTAGTLHVQTDMTPVLDGADYSVLVRIWDNDSDAIFDNL